MNKLTIIILLVFCLIIGMMVWTYYMGGYLPERTCKTSQYGIIQENYYDTSEGGLVGKHYVKCCKIVDEELECKVLEVEE